MSFIGKFNVAILKKVFKGLATIILKIYFSKNTRFFIVNVELEFLVLENNNILKCKLLLFDVVYGGNPVEERVQRVGNHYFENIFF